MLMKPFLLCRRQSIPVEAALIHPMDLAVDSWLWNIWEYIYIARTVNGIQALSHSSGNPNIKITAIDESQ